MPIASRATLSRITLCAMVVFSTSAALAGPAPERAPATMTILSTGTASTSPDLAKIAFGVESAGVNAQEAMAENTRSMTKVFGRLSELGIGKDDIATTGISMTPRFDHRSGSQPRIQGYQVSNKLVVTVSEIDGLGEVLDAIVGAGVNAISSVSFGIRDTGEMEAEARADAARSARRQAEDYAAALGTDVLGVLSVSEAGGGMPRPYAPEMMMRTMAADAGGPVPVSASDVDVSVSLSVVFELSGELD